MIHININSFAAIFVELKLLSKNKSCITEIFKNDTLLSFPGHMSTCLNQDGQDLQDDYGFVSCQSFHPEYPDSDSADKALDRDMNNSTRREALL
ncbi:MAG: hypothetical protein HQK62_13895 [Desulfamplus sp.]|nr:hypothetical protein [Desulfamplus sp.]